MRGGGGAAKCLLTDSLPIFGAVQHVTCCFEKMLDGFEPKKLHRPKTQFQEPKAINTFTGVQGFVFLGYSVSEQIECVMGQHRNVAIYLRASEERTLKCAHFS